MPNGGAVWPWALEIICWRNPFPWKAARTVSRSYPLRITVDGKEAFNGNTQTTLGYYTIPRHRQRGTKLRIQLAGAAATNDTNTGVEVNGKKLDDGVARDDARAKGTLSIIEAEIYEALPVAKPTASLQ